MPQLPLGSGDGLHEAGDSAADIHGRYLMARDEYTCTDCHKGIAHQLPDMRGIDPGWLPPEEQREDLSIQSSLPQGHAELTRYLRQAQLYPCR